jgi:hypothetical protein
MFIVHLFVLPVAETHFIAGRRLSMRLKVPSLYKRGDPYRRSMNASSDWSMSTMREPCGAGARAASGIFVIGVKSGLD